MKEDIMAVKKELEEIKKEKRKLESNFDIGKTFKNIIYFLIFLIIALLCVIIFFVIKNNEMAKELSEYTCETDIMEQDGLYNFIDSEGNMITTDAEVLNKFIEEYYGKTKKDN